MYYSYDRFNLHRSVTVDIADADASACFNLLMQYVHEIVSTHPGPFTLFVSGGLDSQAMLYAWKKAGVEFKAVHVDYMGFNSHDYLECAEFCKVNDIDLEIKQFDILHFLENELEAYATKYQCASPQICTHMAFSTLVPDGTVVFSGNLLMLDLFPLDNTIFGLQRYAEIEQRNMIPFFLLQNEQVAKASIAQSISIDTPNGSYAAKCKLYQSLGIPVIPQVAKQTGFEKLKEYYDQFASRVSTIDKLKYSHLPSKRVFDQLFRNKYLVKFRNHYSPALIVKRGQSVVFEKISS